MNEYRLLMYFNIKILNSVLIVINKQWRIIKQGEMQFLPVSIVWWKGLNTSSTLSIWKLSWYNAHWKKNYISSWCKSTLLLILGKDDHGEDKDISMAII